MIKILLYLSVLFAPGLVHGEGVVALEDSQLSQQLGFCEQGDSKNIDCDDQEDPVSLGFPYVTEYFRSHTYSGLALRSPSYFLGRYFIRAPPTSS